MFLLIFIFFLQKPELPRRVIDHIKHLHFEELTKTTIDRVRTKIKRFAESDKIATTFRQLI